MPLPASATLSTRALARLGLKEDSFLIVLAVLIGLITAAAAVAFHELIDVTRNLLYEHVGERLYGPWMIMLMVWPALGGLAVGLYQPAGLPGSRGARDRLRDGVGHPPSSGFIRPLVAVEKIITSGITIGTGGSA